MASNVNMLLLRNAARCRVCEDVIESTHVHDEKSCTCGTISVDGGHYYDRRTWDPAYTTFEEAGEDLSEWTSDYDKWKEAKGAL